MKRIKTAANLVDIYLTISNIALNVNGLNTNQRERLPEQVKKKKKKNSTIYCLHVIHFKYNDTDILKVKKYRKNISC